MKELEGIPILPRSLPPCAAAAVAALVDLDGQLSPNVEAADICKARTLLLLLLLPLLPLSSLLLLPVPPPAQVYRSSTAPAAEAAAAADLRESVPAFVLAEARNAADDRGGSANATKPNAQLLLLLLLLPLGEDDGHAIARAARARIPQPLVMFSVPSLEVGGARPAPPNYRRSLR